MILFIPGVPKSTQTGSIIRTPDGRAFPSRRGSAWLAYVKHSMAVYAHEKQLVCATGPLEVTIAFNVPRIKDKRRVVPTTRPDLDNLLKGLLDCGNGILWCDDAQIVRLVLEKQYADQPGVWIGW